MKVDDLIPAVFPSTKDLCDALDISKGAVSQWRKSGVPLLRQYQIREIMEQRQNAPTEAAA
jgi:hypothetical protein